MFRYSRLRLPAVLKISTVILVTIWVFAVIAGGDDALQPWHKKAPSSEFDHRDAGTNFSFADYLRLEENVFADLDSMLGGEASPGIVTSRYQP